MSDQDTPPASPSRPGLSGFIVEDGGAEGGGRGAARRARAGPPQEAPLPRTRDTAVEVLGVGVRRIEIDYTPEVAEALASVHPGLKRLPLARTELSLELRGVSAAIANGLRRVPIDELLGYHLDFDRPDFDRGATTDAHMSNDTYVRERLNNVPLRPQISRELIQNLRFALHVENTSASPQAVYTGDLVATRGSPPEPLFNPTIALAVLQPRRAIHINEIRISEGYGNRDHASFNVVARASSVPLDIPKHPRRETHERGGIATAGSGYTVGAGVADPSHFRVTLHVPAAPDNRAVSVAILVDACENLQRRLWSIQQALEATLSAPGEGRRAANARFLTAPSTGDGGVPMTEGSLTVKNETVTVSEILAQTVCDLNPEIAFCAATAQQNQIELKVKVATTEPADVAEVIIDAARHARETYSRILEGVRKHRQ